MRLKVIITELQHNDLVREDLLAHLLTGLGQLRHDFGVVPGALQHRKRQGIVIALLCNFCGGTDPLEKAYLCQRVPNSAPFSFSGRTVKKLIRPRDSSISAIPQAFRDMKQVHHTHDLHRLTETE